MRIGLLMVAALLGACSTDSIPPSPIGSTTASPRASASPGASAPAVFDFACRLPVSWFPADASADAKNSGTALLSLPLPSLSAATPFPTLRFTHGPGYDAVTGKWVPVPADDISPDGLSYAYADYDPPLSGFRSSAIQANGPVIGSTGRVHVVDARTGADRVVFSGQPTYAVVAFTAAGLYLAKFAASLAGSQASGLWLLRAGDGAPQPVAGADYQLDSGGWRVLDGGGAWGIRLTEGQGRMGSGNQLIRLDLTTHATSTWMTRPIDDYVAVLGFDGGRPLVLSQKWSYQTGEPVNAKVVLLTGPDQATQVLATDNASDPLPSTAMPADAGSHGLWIGGTGAVWLYEPASGLRHLNVLAPDSIVEVGGDCV
jgi:hypothetical protein